MVYNRVMNYDYENVIVKDIFTEDQVQMIYDHIATCSDDKKFVQELFSHTAYFNWLPDEVVDRIVEAAQSTSDIELELKELSFARYEHLMDGIEPNLFPHRDETFREPRLTFDIQLKSTKPWPLVVEGKTFVLEDNQALTFSGTHQIHWREKIEFAEGEYMDMIFCHFAAKDGEKGVLGPLPGPDNDTHLSEHHVKMQAKQDYWTKIYNES